MAVAQAVAAPIPVAVAPAVAPTVVAVAVVQAPAVTAEEAAVAVAAQAEAEEVLPADNPADKTKGWSPTILFSFASPLSMRRQHMRWIEQLIQLLFAHQLMLQHQVIHALTCLQRLFGNLRRRLVTDHRIQRCHDADRVLNCL